MIILKKQQQFNLWSILPDHVVHYAEYYDPGTRLRDHIREKYHGSLHMYGEGWVIMFDDPKYETLFRLEVLCSNEA